MTWYKAGRAVFIGIVAFLALAYLAATALASDSYAEANFSRSDAYNRSNIKGEWDMNPHTSGDTTGGQGDFELPWTGAEGGCTDCPTGMSCNCVFGGDVGQEDTFIYSQNLSASLQASGGLHSFLVYIFTFEASKCYQATFCYRGDDGTEDMNFVAANQLFTETYDFATDTWSVTLTTMAFVNIGTTWTCGSAYITTGAAAKADYAIGFSAGSADGNFIYVDYFKVQELNSCGVVGSRGNVLTPDVGSDQIFGAAEVLMQRVGSGPAGWWGLELDSDDDFLDGGDILSPADGKLTVACWVLPDSIVGTHTPISQWHSVANQCSYLLNFDTDDVKWYVDDDGTGATSTMIQDADVLVADTEVRFVATYNQIGSGSSEMTLQVNHEAEVTTNLAVAPIWDSTGDFCVGAAHGGANIFSGLIGRCWVWHRVLDSTERNLIVSPYFPGNFNNSGFYVSSCTQAASHATCSHQKCRDGTPTACQAEGTGVMAVFSQGEEKCVDNSFEAPTGDDSNPDWPDWIEVETVGDGTSEITAYRADTFHGDVAIRMKTTGTTSIVYIQTAGCLTTGIGSDMLVSVKAKKLSGATSLRFYAIEYSDGACATPLTDSFIDNVGDIEETWTDYDGLWPAASWDGTTNSYRVRIFNYRSASDFLVDTISVKAASYRTPWGENPSGAGTTTYNARDYRLHNPLSDYIEAEGKYGYEDGFCAWAWVYTDWAGDDGVSHFVLAVPGTAGNNNGWNIQKHGGNRVYFYLYDGAGIEIRRYSIVSTNTEWTANNFKYIEVCSDNAGIVVGHWYNVANSTWYDLVSTGGAGTGIQDGQSAEVHIGSTLGTNFLDGYFWRFGLTEYSDIYPNEGFNSGKAPFGGGKPY